MSDWIDEELKRHLVVDIETAGVEKGCMILSIGAVCGDRTFYQYIQPVFGSVDPNTLSWWMSSKVPDKARNEIGKLSSLGRPIPIVLKDLLSFIEKTQPEFFWGCSPDFDYGHIEHWIKYCGLNVPWQFWKLRDIRSIRGFLTKEEKEAAQLREICQHIAIDDALQEQAYLRAFLEKVGPCHE